MRAGEMATLRRSPVPPLLRQRRLDAAVRAARRPLRRAHRRHGHDPLAYGRRSRPRSAGSTSPAIATATASSSMRARPTRACPTRAGRTATTSIFHADGRLADGPDRRSPRCRPMSTRASTLAARCAAPARPRRPCARAGRSRRADARANGSSARSGATDIAHLRRWRSTAPSSRAACAPPMPARCCSPASPIPIARARSRAS